MPTSLARTETGFSLHRPPRAMDDLVAEIERWDPVAAILALELWQHAEIEEKAGDLRRGAASRIIQSIAVAARPEDEAVRFIADLDPNPAPSPLTGLLPPGKTDRFVPSADAQTGSDQWRARVAFFGLLGPAGVLPNHYRETVYRLVRRVRSRQPADFFDIFTHRLVGQFYRASTKYRLPVSRLRGSGVRDARATQDTVTEALLGLVGLGTSHHRRRLPFPDTGAIHFAGILSAKPPSVGGLTALIRAMFGLRVTVRPFVGRWISLSVDDQTSMTPPDLTGGGPRLGRTTMVGSRVLDLHGAIEIRLEMPDQLTFQRFMPRGPGLSMKDDALERLEGLVRLYLGPALSLRLRLAIRRRHLPGLGFDGSVALGCNGWLPVGGAADPDAWVEDAVFDLP